MSDARGVTPLDAFNRELAKRYATPLLKRTAEVETLTDRFEEHLKKMDVSW